MSGVVANVQAGYDGVAAGARAKINTTNVSAIWITTDAPGDTEYVSASKIIKIGRTLTVAQMTSDLQVVATYDIIP
jgi:hypothetical protein